MANKTRKLKKKPPVASVPVELAEPSSRQAGFTVAVKAFFCAILVIVVFFIWAISVNFVASAFWENLSMKIALEIAAIFGLVLIWAMWTGRINPSDRLTERFWIMLLTPFFFFGIAWSGLRGGVGDMVTRVAGSTDTVEMRFERKNYNVDDECLEVSGTAAGKNVPETFCLTADAVAYTRGDLPQRFHATLVVTHSRFGRLPFKLNDVRPN